MSQWRYAVAVAVLPWWVAIPAWASPASPEVSCVDDAPHVCGPNNPEGKPAACYDDGGVIVAMWPCNPWEPNMGHRHADGTTTYPNGDVGTDDGELISKGTDTAH